MVLRQISNKREPKCVIMNKERLTNGVCYGKIKRISKDFNR